MTRPIQQTVSGLIVGCMLLLNTLALPQVVMHGMHHDQHSSSTHNSPICFWICTASQMEESSAVLPNQIAQLIAIVHSQLFSQPLLRPSPYLFARGPPAPSFASSFFHIQ